VVWLVLPQHLDDAVFGTLSGHACRQERQHRHEAGADPRVTRDAVKGHAAAW